MRRPVWNRGWHLMILKVINGLINERKESCRDKNCAGSLDRLMYGRDVVKCQIKPLTD